MQENPIHSSLSKTHKKAKFSLVKFLLTLVLLVAAVAGVGWGIWSYRMYSQAQKQLSQLTSLEGQQELAQQEIAKVVDQVKKHIKLPEDEEPLMATVVNAEALIAEQNFYQGAQDGDKIIVYVNAKKAILYNPKEDVLVNVGPIFLDQNAAAQQPEPTASPVPTASDAASLSPELEIRE